MNKNVTYKNIVEYMKITFPSVYKYKKYSDEFLLKSIIKKNTDDFKFKKNIILKDNKNINGV